jgi:CheY-like chemotaxis protein
MAPHEVLLLPFNDAPSAILLMGRMPSQCPKQRFATAGDAALGLVCKATPDLLLLDAQLPGMDGFGIEPTQAPAMLRDISDRERLTANPLPAVQAKRPVQVLTSAMTGEPADECHQAQPARRMSKHRGVGRFTRARHRRAGQRLRRGRALVQAPVQSVQPPWQAAGCGTPCGPGAGDHTPACGGDERPPARRKRTGSGKLLHPRAARCPGPASRHPSPRPTRTMPPKRQKRHS